MLFSKPTRFSLTAGILALSFGLGGLAFGSTSSSRRVHHAAVKPQSARRSSVHRASYRHGHGRRVTRRHAVSLGQKAMDSQRTTAIQQALIAAHYLNGSPTGQWDPESQSAMQKYQADNGWQSKITPDSRAIIKLGLGPKQDDGEYSSNPTGVSSLSKTASADAIGTMATSEMPSSTQN